MKIPIRILQTFITSIVIVLGSLFFNANAAAQIPDGVYQIKEGTKLEFMAVGSDDNVLRWGKSSNPLDSLWHITTGEHPEKGKYYQFQSLKNGLFLTASIAHKFKNLSLIHI